MIHSDDPKPGPLSRILNIFIPQSLGRRFIFLGFSFGLISVLIVAIGMGAILNRRIEVNEAARLGPLMAAIYSELKTGNHTQELDVSSIPYENLNIRWLDSLPTAQQASEQNALETLPAGQDFPEITIYLERGTLRRRLFQEATDFASLNTVLTDMAVGLARHDRVARVYLKRGAMNWVEFSSPKYWKHRTSETIWVLTMLVVVGLCAIAYMLISRAIAHPYRQIATLPPSDEARLPDMDWFWTRESRAIRHTAHQERENRKEIIAERTRMLAAISHDLRTPATRIQLRTDYIENEEVRGKILQDLDSMLSMITDAIDFLKGSIVQEPMEKLDFPSLLQSICDDYADTGQPVSFLNPKFDTVTTKGTVFGSFIQEVELKDVLTGYISGQPKALGRVFSNLIGNAIKYGFQARVALQISPKEIIIEITDRGPGIPEEELENVFKPFYRLEKSRNRQTGGSGLGLSIARSVIDLHKGQIDLVNLPQEGLLARVILPRSLVVETELTG